MIPEKESKINELVEAIQKLVKTAYIYPLQRSKEFDLTLSQSSVVKNLAINGPLSSAELSRKLYVTPSNITGVIDRLEKKELVQRIRKQNDRRVYLISLTEKGMKIGNCLPDPFEKKVGTNLKSLESEKIQHLSQAVEQIIALIEKEH